MKKCNHCEIKQLKTILFHEFEFQKCYQCDYIRIFEKDFENFIHKILNEYNIGNIKRYDSFFNCNDYEQKMINDFYNVFNELKTFDRNSVSEKACDICLEPLYHFYFYKKFHVYICADCSSIYFLQKEFNEFIELIISEIKRKNHLLFLKVKFKNKIRKFYFKIKEIFLYRRRKNNVKK
jgi:hypothetical protein